MVARMQVFDVFVFKIMPNSIEINKKIIEDLLNNFNDFLLNNDLHRVLYEYIVVALQLMLSI